MVRAHTARMGGRTNWLGKITATARMLMLRTEGLLCGRSPKRPSIGSPAIAIDVTPQCAALRLQQTLHARSV